MLTIRKWPELGIFALGVSGKIGSGKSTLISHLIKEHDFSVASYGAYFRNLAAARKLPNDRETFQFLTEEYLKTYDHRKLAAAMINLSGWDGSKSLLIDGVRHLESIEALSSLVYPIPFFTVFLDVSEQRRINRIRRRDGLSPDLLISHDYHESELSASTEVKASANVIISEMKLDEAISQIYKFLSKPR